LKKYACRNTLEEILTASAVVYYSQAARNASTQIRNHMNSGLPIEFTVRIDFQDYWRASTAYMLRHFRLKWLIVSAGLYLALFLYLNFTNTYHGQTYPLLIPLAALGFLYAVLYLNTKMLFAGKKFLQHPVRYVFSSEGVKAIAARQGKPAGARFLKLLNLKMIF